jgi:hypothetical protein
MLSIPFLIVELNVVMLNVIMLNVVAPKSTFPEYIRPNPEKSALLKSTITKTFLAAIPAPATIS